MLCFVLLLSGCGGSHGHQGKLIFKGQVQKVEYHLLDGYTTLIDAEGKKIRLKGYPGIPTAEVEIYEDSHHGYEVLRVAKSS
jgi:hypothetical protein